MSKKTRNGYGRSLYQARRACKSDLDPAALGLNLALGPHADNRCRVSIAPAWIIGLGLRLGLSPADVGDGIRELIAGGWLTDVDLESDTATIAVPNDKHLRIGNRTRNEVVT